MADSNLSRFLRGINVNASDQMSSAERERVFERLSDILCDVLDLDSVELEDSTTATDVPGWDSLAHIRLVLAIEQAFNLRFAVTDVPGLRNVGELVDRIIERSRK